MRESTHFRGQSSTSPAIDLQPAGLVQSRGAIGRADRACGSPDRGGAIARRRRRPDRPAADRADVAVHPVRDPRRPAGRPNVAAAADGGCRSAARRGAARNPRADRSQSADIALARACRLRSGVRHGRLQRGRPGAGAVAGVVATASRRQCADRTGATVAFASGPAVGGVLVGWVGAAPGVRFRCRAFCCRGGVARRDLRAGATIHATAPPAAGDQGRGSLCLHHPLLRPVFITQFIFNTASFLCSRCSYPMRCVVSRCRQQALAPRSQCTASAWYSARCWRRG